MSQGKPHPSPSPDVALLHRSPNTSGVRGAAPPAVGSGQTPKISATLKKALHETDDELKSILLEYLSKPTSPELPAVYGNLLDDPTSVSSEEPKPVTQSPPSWEVEAEPDTGVFHPDPGEAHLAFARDRGVLIRVDGPSGGEVISLGRIETMVGRSSKAEVHLTDSGVSRRHARLSYENGCYQVEDLGSSNGTFVSGKPIARQALTDGDLIRFGPRASFRYSMMDSAQEAVMKRLYESSIYDSLTQAVNRRHFEERLEAEVAYCLRHKSTVAVVLLDIDFFKSINDNYGHPAGDRVLQEVSRVAQSQLRTEDLFARYGGEEFAAILRGVGLEGAGRAANRMRLSIAEHAVDIGGMRIAVTISAGCATLACLERPSASALIQLADRRLYEAKHSGRNRVVMTGSG